jgi:hypothetical protein
MLDDQIINFYNNIDTSGFQLPEGISILNPYQGEKSADAPDLMQAFYQKFYHDDNPRTMVLGINPGRFGAGSTGLMFTDTLRLEKHCGIHARGLHTRELSSEFFYMVVEAMGGAEKFYSKFYVGAVSPLGFVKGTGDGKVVNYNYYDSQPLQQAVKPFIVKSLQTQLSFHIKKDVCYCLGTGKNHGFLEKLSGEHNWFGKIIPLEHPRFIMQYKRKLLEEYIDKYVEKLSLFF